MTPWELAKTTEHSHQRAVFAWANCAALYGFDVANDPRGYTLADREKLIQEMARTGWRPSPDAPALKLLFAIHNQGHGDKVRGGIAKAEGVKAGVGDMMLPVPKGPFHGLFIELKRPGNKEEKKRAGQAQTNQLDWGLELSRQGYSFNVCVGWEQAVDCIIWYLSHA